MLTYAHLRSHLSSSFVYMHFIFAFFRSYISLLSTLNLELDDAMRSARI